MTFSSRLAGATGVLTLGLLLSATAPSGAATASAAKKPAPSKKAAPTAGMTPDQVVQAFLKAQQNGDDDASYVYLSSDAKKKYNQERWNDQGRQVRITFSAIKMLVEDTLVVGGAANANSKVTATATKGNTATVKLVQTVPLTNTLHLVKENGKWMIDIQKSLSADDTPAATATTPPKPITPAPPVTPPTPQPQDYSQICRGNLRQVGVALRVYALDHDGKLPDAKTWTDAIAPFLDNAAALRCPPDAQDVKSSYAMNSALSGAQLSTLNQPEKRVLLYESTTKESNVNGTGATMPEKAPRPAGYLVLMANGDAVFQTQRPTVQ